MTAPDKIWAWDYEQGGVPRAGDWVDEESEAPDGSAEYTRSDLIPQSDPNTRIVHAKLIGLWADEWEKTIELTPQYCDVDKLMIEEMRALIGEVKP
jgi:hypothetical protein